MAKFWLVMALGAVALAMWSLASGRWLGVAIYGGNAIIWAVRWWQVRRDALAVAGTDP